MYATHLPTQDQRLEFVDRYRTTASPDCVYRVFCTLDRPGGPYPRRDIGSVGDIEPRGPDQSPTFDLAVRCLEWNRAFDTPFTPVFKDLKSAIRRGDWLQRRRRQSDVRLAIIKASDEGGPPLLNAYRIASDAGFPKTGPNKRHRLGDHRMEYLMVGIVPASQILVDFEIGKKGLLDTIDIKEALLSLHPIVGERLYSMDFPNGASEVRLLAAIGDALAGALPDPLRKVSVDNKQVLAALRSLHTHRRIRSDATASPTSSDVDGDHLLSQFETSGN